MEEVAALEKTMKVYSSSSIEALKSCENSPDEMISHEDPLDSTDYAVQDSNIYDDTIASSSMLPGIN